MESVSFVSHVLCFAAGTRMEASEHSYLYDGVSMILQVMFEHAQYAAIVKLCLRV